QLRAQRGKVLDDPVEHDVDTVFVVVVGVRVRLGHASVGRPARVTDAGRGGRLGGRNAALADLLGDRVLQKLEVADRTYRLDLAVFDQRQAGGVVAAVLQALEACEQKLPTRTLAHISNDSAHAGPPSLKT